ncbi:universal stress protein [Halosolutus amylolyticus]|uniref:Universal stress protein n=1 Tax=Halosolutus amylolyticus TaxID=2932267 RepID=A0ABD5PPP8_9EURY|nr:universal stress protein [Halosolutus amylolyticus]
MDTILVPVPGHDKWSKETAEVLADIETDPEVFLLYTFTDEDVSTTSDNLGQSPESVDLDELASRKSAVRMASRALETAGIETNVVGASGDEDRGDAILSTIDDVDADRAYIFSRKRSPVGKAVFGSAIQDVLFESPVPIVVVPLAAV